MTQEHTSPEQIQREIQTTRSDIDRKLDVLQERFSPGQMIDQAIGYMKSGSGEFGRNLSQVVRDNPVPVVLLGAGVAWLAIAGARKSSADSPSSRVSRSSGDSRDTAAPVLPQGTSQPSSGIYRSGDRVGSTNMGPAGDAGRNRDNESDDGESIGDKAAKFAGQARERISEIGSDTKEKLDAASHRTRELAEDMRERGSRAKEATKEFAHERPLVVGAIGLAIGAAIAAALPITRRENEILGEKSDALKDSAKQQASEQLEKAKDVAKAAAEGAKEKAEEHGLPTGAAATAATAEKTSRRASARQSVAQSAPAGKDAAGRPSSAPQSTPRTQRPAGSPGKPPAAS